MILILESLILVNLTSRDLKAILETLRSTMMSTVRTMSTARMNKNKIRMINKTTMTMILKKIPNMMKKTIIMKKNLCVNQLSI